MNVMDGMAFSEWNEHLDIPVFFSPRILISRYLCMVHHRLFLYLLWIGKVFIHQWQMAYCIHIHYLHRYIDIYNNIPSSSYLDTLYYIQSSSSIVRMSSYLPYLTLTN